MRSNRIHNPYNNMTFLESINLMIVQSGCPEKVIAADIGKPLSTLQRELNPYDDGAKVGVETLPSIIHSCSGDDPKKPPEPLSWLCHKFGFEPVKHGSAEPNAATIELECLESVQSMARVHSAIMEGKHPNEVAALITLAKIDLDQDLTLYRRNWEAANREQKD